MVITNCPTILR